VAVEEKPIAKVAVVCGIVLLQDNKYLLVQEKQPKVYGKWNLPAGRVDEGENLEQAAVREAKEETGFDVKIDKHLIVIHPSIESPVLHAFLAEAIGGELKFPKDELLDARWFSYEEVADLKEQLRREEYVLGAIEAARESS
jgi:8-oxo-dGTP diphosphatase